jgi:hypothetical protein
MFGRKNKEIRCEYCDGKLKSDFIFCPYCGESLYEEDEEELGMLGRDDELMPNLNNLGISEKMLSGMMNTLIKSLNKELGNNMANMDKNDKPEVKTFPNGIKISIGSPVQKKNQQKTQLKEVTEEQQNKMINLPRTPAKAKIKRLSDKIVYELSTPGVNSTEDIFISKIESGYEVKVIGDKKVYVNSLPINLPLKGYSLSENTVSVEFKSH